MIILKEKIRLIIRNYAAYFYYIFFILRHHFRVLTDIETIKMIISDNKSIARFGDGEFKWILGVKQNSFQNNNEALSNRLSEILVSDSKSCLICIPRILRKNDHYSSSALRYWSNFLRWHGRVISYYLSSSRMYGDSYFTRWYRGKKMENSDYKKYVELLKTIWDKRDVLIVEGELTRFGVGNDLLDNTRSVERIIAPSKNAFSQYDEILRLAKKYGNDKLILVALGPTATVLAYDLSEYGIQAIDIGHVDVEYEWFLRGAHEQKVPIRGKYVNEVGGMFEEMSDEALEEYKRQIVTRVKVSNEKN